MKSIGLGDSRMSDTTEIDKQLIRGENLLREGNRIKRAINNLAFKECVDLIAIILCTGWALFWGAWWFKIYVLCLIALLWFLMIYRRWNERHFTFSHMMNMVESDVEDLKKEKAKIR